MIKSFKSNSDHRFFEMGEAPRKSGWAQITKSVARKLDMLDAATDLSDLRSPPSNRLEALKGDRKGQYSIRINDQWRVCFRWQAGNAYDVEIVDYH